eukprot:6306853-Amphidinium_carterae.1
MGDGHSSHLSSVAHMCQAAVHSEMMILQENDGSPPLGFPHEKSPYGGGVRLKDDPMDIQVAAPAAATENG